MAFQSWCLDNEANVQTANEFSTETSREKGYQPGDTASSKVMNTILKQNTLITNALMDSIVGADTDLSIDSTPQAIKQNIDNKLNTYATKTDLNTTNNNVTSVTNDFNEFKEGITTGTIKPVQSINSENALTANNYSNAGNIKEKFDDIDTRLTNLGFKSGNITFASGPNKGTVAGTITRQGNYCVLHITQDLFTLGGGGNFELNIDNDFLIKKSLIGTQTELPYYKTRYYLFRINNSGLVGTEVKNFYIFFNNGYTDKTKITLDVITSEIYKNFALELGYEAESLT